MTYRWWEGKSKLARILNGMQCSSSLYDDSTLEWMKEATERIDSFEERLRSQEKDRYAAV
jgi:hypothetical protein